MSASGHTPVIGHQRNFHVQALAWPASALLIAAHYFWADPGFEPVARVCAGALASLVVLSFAYLSPRTVPLMPIALFQFYNAMGRPVFGPPRLYAYGGPVHLSRDSLDQALIAAVLFILVAIAAAHATDGTGHRGASWLTRRLKSTPTWDIRNTITVRTIAFSLIALFCFISFRGMGGLGGLAFALVLVANPAIPIGLLFWDLEANPTLVSRALFYGAVVVLSLFGLGSGMLGAAVVPGVVAAVWLWTSHGRAPWLLASICIAVMITFNAAKHDYRELSGEIRGTPSALQRIENWQEALDRTYAGDSQDAIKTGVDAAASRTAVLSYVAQIFEWVPRRVPYAGIERWAYVPLLFLPRAIWPGKPNLTEFFNNHYSTTFSLQKRRDTGGTTINLPSVGDGYWRLGWLGVVIEGLLLGCLFGFFVGLSRGGVRECVLISTAFTASLRVDAHVVKTVSGIPQLLLVLVGMLWLTRIIPELLPSPRPEPSPVLNRNRVT